MSSLSNLSGGLRELGVFLGGLAVGVVVLVLLGLAYAAVLQDLVLRNGINWDATGTWAGVIAVAVGLGLAWQQLRQIRLQDEHIQQQHQERLKRAKYETDVGRTLALSDKYFAWKLAEECDKLNVGTNEFARADDENFEVYMKFHDAYEARTEDGRTTETYRALLVMMKDRNRIAKAITKMDNYLTDAMTLIDDSLIVQEMFLKRFTFVILAFFRISYRVTTKMEQQSAIETDGLKKITKLAWLRYVRDTARKDIRGDFKVIPEKVGLPAWVELGNESDSF